MVAYTGPTGQTRRDTYHIGCECGCSFVAEIHRSIHLVEDGHLLEQYYRGDLDRAVCPSCGREHQPHVARVIHDPRLPILALVVPEELRHEEFELMADLWLRFAKEDVDIPAYAKQVQVVYGPEALRAVLRQDRSANEASSVGAISDEQDQLNEFQAQLAVRENLFLVAEQELAARQAEAAAMRQQLARQRQALDEQQASLDRQSEALTALELDVSVRQRVEHGQTGEPARKGSWSPAAGELPEGLRQEVDRFRASDRRAEMFLHEGRVMLVARLEGRIDAFQALPPRLMVQLHTIDDFPLVTLVAMPAGTDRSTDQAVHWPFDARVELHRSILEQLGHEFSLQLDLYDDESRAVGSWSLEAPLAENAAYLLQRAAAMLEAPHAAEMPLEAILTAFQALGAERFGHRQHYLHEGSFAQLPSPGATRIAVYVVNYWSKPTNEDYLILTMSFPLPHWRLILHRVLSRAIEFGLHLDRRLAEIAIDQQIVESAQMLLQHQLANFAQVCRWVTPGDLHSLHEWDNWQLLLMDCERQGVVVDRSIEAAIAVSGRRARSAFTSWSDAMRALGEHGLLAAGDVVQNVNELDDRDIVDQEEMLGDADIVAAAPLDDEVVEGVGSADDRLDASSAGGDGGAMAPAADDAGGLQRARNTLEIAEEDIIERTSEAPEPSPK